MPSRDRVENTAVLDRPIDDAGVNGETDAGAPEASTEGVTKRAPKRNPDELGPKEVVGVTLRLPNELRMQIAQTATEQNTSVPQLLAEMVANAYGYELPKTERAPRIKKYANKEERLEAQKAQQRENRLKTRAVLEAIQTGKLEGIDLDALVADIKARDEAKTSGAAAS